VIKCRLNIIDGAKVEKAFRIGNKEFVKRKTAENIKKAFSLGKTI
jgi:hypothetical protein